MRTLSVGKTGWFALVCIIFQSSWLLSCGSAIPSSQKYLGNAADKGRSAQTDETFSALWEERTIYPTQVGGGGMGLLSSPFSGTGGPPGRGGFPLRITASLMDSMLIQAGFRHYIDLLKMSPDEESEFRQSYNRLYDPASHILVWCELQTSWAKLHLDLDRWFIFIEDDKQNQYEPVRISEEPSSFDQKIPEVLTEEPLSGRSPLWTSHRKNLMLLFPNRNFLGNPVISPEVKFLKLVFLSSDDNETRAEGSWVFKK